MVYVCGEFCEHMTEKTYVHISEIPTILMGFVDEHQCEINATTGLPKGMIAGTTADNFIIYRGGWNCGHQLMPISEVAVPEEVREKFEGVSEYKKYRNGGEVLIAKGADKSELRDNVKLANFLAAKNGDIVKVRMHINKDGISNPELEINGRLADRKTPNHNTYKNVASPIKNLAVKAQEQGATHVVMELWDRYDIESVGRGLRDAFFYAGNMDIIDIVFKHESIARVQNT